MKCYVTISHLMLWLNTSTLSAYTSTLPAYTSTLPAYTSTLPAYTSTLSAYTSTLPDNPQNRIFFTTNGKEPLPGPPGRERGDAPFRYRGPFRLRPGVREVKAVEISR